MLDESKDFGEAVIVIVHELIHLKVPNHGPVFRSLMKAYFPKSSKLLVNQVARGEPRNIYVQGCQSQQRST
jgi:hypothetical protein